MTLRTSPLDAAHRALGAKMVPFGGWDMPLSYPAGTLAEHRSCRQGAVAFDVSHLGTVRITGPEALDRLQAALTNDLTKVGPGRAQYTHLLDPADASVVDDIIVWWVDDERFDVMPNASNTDGVVGALGEGAVDVTAERAIIALQGPAARRLLAPIWPEAAAIGRFHVITASWDGVECTVAGTGYTGEDGLEVAVPAEHAGAFWDAVLAAGFEPAGLGARDTLRLEAGLPLHGHELGAGITPLQAGLGWVVAWDKGDFRGRAALDAEREAGVARRLRALTIEGRRPPRADQVVLVDGQAAGVITSGNFSPILEQGIALAFCPPEVAIGDTVAIDVRGEAVAATVVKPPFVTATPSEPVA
ncbi:glycine cleavage system aminomethyltransferase GcvT [Aquihabitans sp. G128]|uniref:glycine cleavage system aminomethyltransferase GcvT n=1 Tax=Aquihabitans sp. G128 TaxID=2849779 RepID=UPI001C235CCB|nr:glycine cleavage system aminomethyltransferase GcvT [Aquihabitans sp. G128]QXC61983.1 glycine cleavage system aminomethyltransferase GcvT [Aquihabitans sp. G128]